MSELTIASFFAEELRSMSTNVTYQAADPEHISVIDQVLISTDTLSKSSSKT